MFGVTVIFDNEAAALAFAHQNHDFGQVEISPAEELQD